MKLLMHICCANCALYPVKKLVSDGMEFKGLWFNPNIHPDGEYSKRLDSVRMLQGLWGFDIEYEDSHGPQTFINAIRNRTGLRCEACYLIRLEETALTAKKMGLDGFTTTLLVSPYQKFDLIVDIGKHLANKHSLRFFAEDFRPGWTEASKLSRELGLYRQKYCGCIFSKDEREAERRPPSPLDGSAA